MASDTASEEPRQATREEMREARLPLAYRDSCAHLLIPLNQCRRETWYAPWKCGPSAFYRHPSLRWCADRWPGRLRVQDERHSYEKCQYVEFKKRVAKMDELRESKNGARSN
ncbi:hypothetical protein DCS_05999 [Drechmeria coniospora]|uniref:NADH dehydrogenase [ubiquinone] 1 beta subcomplex subunit 7 n=1 Tax=Drechmeria coniospora TaxID=98403 RepID=A0A151GAD8_DRECN|nr:hypothetical protein DCS_05999 [Drechmeria coniospora]KYK54045.1 hypothetical protein DCS_05999 [Drechmeria coniospora]